VGATRGMVSLLASAALGLAFCHPTDRPPVQPPKPTDPTSMTEPAPAEVAEVTDASIVTDGNVGWDGGRFELDTGASFRRAGTP
jgi:hypothetical protein